MKKYILTFVISLISLTSIVSADTIDTTLDYFYHDFDNSISFYNSNSSKIDMLINEWQTKYSSTHPYYFITYNSTVKNLVLYYSSIPNIIINSSGNLLSLDTSNNFDNYGDIFITGANNSSQIQEHPYNGDTKYAPIYYSYSGSDASATYPLFNHNMIFSSSDIILSFPPFTSSTYNFSIEFFQINNTNILPSYLDLYQGSYEPGPTYVEINLNSYSYIALSLKNYDVDEPFTTNIITKGQLCITPVYDYGMKEKESAGYQVNRCSPYYDSFTPVVVYILQQDIDNNSIYYLKAYDTSKDNIVKIDTNVFNISYITSQDENNPYVTVSGRTYPTIPYNNLSSTATKSEEEGYVSGTVNNVFDVSSDSNFISNLFSNPLETLGSVWTSIITFFALIGSFIGLLPNTMQTFLYTSFSLGLALGLIKILIS